MARLSTIDDNERRKYEEFNRRTYGTTLEASQNNRRRSGANQPEIGRVPHQNQTASSHTQVANTNTEPTRPQPRPTTRRTTRRQRTYRPTRKDRRIKAKLPTYKKKISLPARWLIRLLSLGFLFVLQVVMTIITLGALGLLNTLESSWAPEWVAGLAARRFEGLAMVAWYLMILIGWLTVTIVLLIFVAIGARPLLGKHAGIKMSLFFGTLVLYSIPGVNLLPWCFVWAEFVIRNPR